MPETKKIPKRSEAEKQYTWATEDMFASDEKWEEALAEMSSMPDRLAAYKGKLGESGATLLEYLQLGDELGLAIGLIANYAFRKADEDTSVGKYQEMRGKVISMTVKTGAQGRLYGSITSAEVAAELKKQHGVDVDKRDIKCENIRAVGDVAIEVRIYKDISAKMTVHVEGVAAK